MQRVLLFAAAIGLLTLFSILSCKKDDNGNSNNNNKKLPVLTTNEVTDVQYSSAKSGGVITDDGGSAITERGVCWSTEQNPTINDNKTSDGTGAGSFTSSITGLEPETIYYVRAYATNTEGAAYGSQIQFATEQAGEPPVAAFVVSDTIGIAPLTVSFTDQSAHNPTSWEWSFGDGNNSTVQNPVHIYQDAGSYTLQLTVTNSHGSDTVIKSNYISVTSGGGGGTGEPCPGAPTVTDIDGNVYNTVLIGEQCWMKENLNTTRDAEGNYITRYCYNNNTSNCNWYGGLYTWRTAMNDAGSSNSNPSGVQGICPTGWHIPSDDELTQLVDYVVAQGFPNRNVAHGAANALKSCRQVNSWLGVDCYTHEHPRWNSWEKVQGFDALGFAGLPGGQRSPSSGFYNLGDYGHWWSSFRQTPHNATSLSISCSNGNVYRYSNYELVGFSVRCIND